MNYTVNFATMLSGSTTDELDCEQKDLLVCLPKNGRLNGPALSYIEEKTGINPTNDVVNGVNFLFLREKDIASLLRDNFIDIGIVGQNSFDEVFANASCENVSFSGIDFGQCRLSIAIPNESEVTSLQDLEYKKILTSYPKQLKKFLIDQGMDDFAGFTKNDNPFPLIKTYEGGLETLMRLTGADAICDIVQTGESLRQENMRELIVINQISAGICYREKPVEMFSPEAQLFMQKLSVTNDMPLVR